MCASRDKTSIRQLINSKLISVRLRCVDVDLTKKKLLPYMMIIREEQASLLQGRQGGIDRKKRREGDEWSRQRRRLFQG